MNFMDQGLKNRCYMCTQWTRDIYSVVLTRLIHLVHHLADCVMNSRVSGQFFSCNTCILARETRYWRQTLDKWSPYKSDFRYVSNGSQTV